MTEKAKGAITCYKVCIPISFISIEKPFKIGNIKFEYFEKGFFDDYISHTKEKAQESQEFNDNSFRIFEMRFRKRYQGVVFALITIEAEKQRCIELAKAGSEWGQVYF